MVLYIYIYINIKHISPISIICT